MDEPTPAPGEVRFDVERPSAPPPSAPQRREIPWWLAVGAFALFALLIGWLSKKYPNGFGESRIQNETLTAAVPAPPEPPGAYAVFSLHGTAGAAATHAAVAFLHERLVILRVPPNEISEADRARALDESGAEASPGKMRVASRFDDETSAAVKTAADRARGHLEAATPPPYILHGDVDITCGELTNDDAGYAAMLLEDGSLSRASIHLADGTPRGPPVPVRTVYIVGNVRDVSGPEQYKHSVLLSSTVDLGPTDTGREAYKQKLEAWNRQIVELEARLHVPAEDLRSYAGTTVTARNRRVVSAEDRDGKSVPEPAEVENRYSGDAGTEGGEHDPNRPARREHPMEHGVP